jgi:hypothetical protein
MLPLVGAFCGILLFLVASGCSDSRDGNTPVGDRGSAVASTGLPPARDAPTILLFNGSGTSRNDVAALEAILTHNHFSCSVVNSEHLNAMSEAQIREYRLLIIPGGNFERIGSGLAASTGSRRGQPHELTRDYWGSPSARRDSRGSAGSVHSWPIRSQPAQQSSQADVGTVGMVCGTATG